MNAQRVTLLLIEPDDELAAMIRENVGSAAGTTVHHVPNGVAALDLCTRHMPDIIVSEMQLPDGDALALIRTLRTKHNSRATVILLSDQPTVGRAVEAMRLGVRDLFTKPFDLRRLSHVLEQEVARRRDRKRTARRRMRLCRAARKVIRERRDLRERMDLICRDVVSAYHRLAQRVAEHEPTKT